MADVPDSKSGGSDTVRVRPPLPAPKKKRNFDTKLRFFFFAQNRLNKGFFKKDKFLSEIFNRKNTLLYLENTIKVNS